MKIVLSRKGFDSTYGGFPSPILEDGRIISLPIPSENCHDKNIRYKDLRPRGVNLGSLLQELGKTPKINGTPAKFVHFDPDIYDYSMPKNNKLGTRQKGWRGLFGQGLISARVLQNEKTGVKPGDIFLFFGWFNHVVNLGGKRSYAHSQGFHQIWGWLQIGEIIDLRDPVSKSKVPEYAKYHPHCQYTEDKPNVLFIASEELKLEGYNTDGIKGYGTISHFSEFATLTEMDPEKNNKYYNEFQIGIGKHESPNQDIKTSLWRLPLWFYHEDITKRLGYHNKNNKRTKASWHKDGKFAYLKSTSPGQEFILDLDHYPKEAKQWVWDIITSGSNH